MMDKQAAARLEETIMQIPEVRAARLVTDEGGNPIEVHIIAGGDKSPKQLVRDVQTVSLAALGVSLDHRIVSVVQFPTGDRISKEISRPSIQEIVTETKGAVSSVRVILETDGRDAHGEATGPTSLEGVQRLAAAATIEAVKSFLSNGRWISLDHVTIQRAGSKDIALATLTVGGKGTPISVSGSAVVGSQHPEAIARAVLDALNRLVFAT